MQLECENQAVTIPKSVFAALHTINVCRVQITSESLKLRGIQREALSVSRLDSPLQYAIHMVKTIPSNFNV